MRRVRPGSFYTRTSCINQVVVPGFSFLLSGIDPEKSQMTEVYAKFGLDENTASFTGHALALHVNDK